MRYMVTWADEALDELADLWTLAPDRDAVNRAEIILSKALSHQPETCGKELSEGLWVAEVDPLRIYYEIHPQDLLVRVNRVISTT